MRPSENSTSFLYSALVRLDAVVVLEIVAGQEGGGLDEAKVVMACGHLPAVVAEAVDGK